MNARTLVWWGGIALFLLASLVIASPVFAADSFVDQATGLDSNSCINPAHACATIAAGIVKAGMNDTIHVGPGIYPEQLSLDSGKSLKATGTPASTVITSAALPTVDVPGPTAAGTIEGFTIRGTTNNDNSGVVRLAAGATVRGNVFDGDGNDASLTGLTDVYVASGAGSPTITQNGFFDDGDGAQFGVEQNSASIPVISNNEMSGLAYGVLSLAGTPTISGNVISGIHNGPSNTQTAGISIQDNGNNSAGTVTANFIHDPVTTVHGTPDGISIVDFDNGAAAPNVTATLSRNRVQGGHDALSVTSAIPAVTLNSDLFANASIGISAFDGSGGSGDISATNVTVASNTTDITLNATVLTLDSSIVEDAIGTSGTVSCAITFSRGPTTTPGGNGCANFTTTASPGFVTPGSDFHLQGSPRAP